MKSFVKFLCVFFLFASSLSCKKYLAIEEVDGRFLVDQVFSSDSAANSAVAGIYRKWRDLNNSAVSPSVLCGLSSDELRNYFPQRDYDGYYKNQISPNSILLPWAALYNIIYESNACLEALEQSDQVSEESKKYFAGEVKFIRAHCYFSLVNLFGEVPLLFTTDIKQNAVEKRKPVDSVYAKIIEDLRESVVSMSDDIFSEVGSQRINQYSAKSFLARVYLFTGDWTSANELANQVIDSDRYLLLNDLDGVFLANSREAIFQFSNNSLDLNGEAFAFIGSTPNIVCSNSLINSFENADQRKEKWIKAGNYLGGQYFYPYKYKIPGGTQSELHTLLRIAELYLIRAETNICLLNIPDAVSDINIIRKRAGLSPLSTSLSPDSCLNALMRERRSELFAESGHRWFDIKRRKIVNEIMVKEKGNLWMASDSLYPIPAADIQRNPNLVQNRNY